MEQHVVSISRAWGRDTPILMSVTNHGVGLEIGLADFLRALAAEVGNPAFILTQAQLQARLEGAAIAACEKVKAVTAGHL